MPALVVEKQNGMIIDPCEYGSGFGDASMPEASRFMRPSNPPFGSEASSEEGVIHRSRPHPTSVFQTNSGIIIDINQ